jgi:cytidylate kinase
MAGAVSVQSPRVVAIDGPSGSGKGTVSRRVAAALGWHLLDSGALYRVLAFAAQAARITANEPVHLGDLARDLKVGFSETADGAECIRLDGLDVTRAVRSEECGNQASILAAIPEVRNGLKQLQRGFRHPPGLVADGRDMGTVIFPDAVLKIFLTASATERAQRRYNQLKEQGLNASLGDLFLDISARDDRDHNRAVSPLQPAADAVRLDTTGMGIQQVVEHVLELARQRL